MSSWRTSAASRLRRLRRVALPLAFLVFWTGAAHAELVHSGPVADARIALESSGEPVVAYVADGLLSLASRDAATATWSSRPLFILPSQEVELDGLAVAASGRTSVLLRSTNGSWLALAAEVAPGRWLWRMIVPDTPRDLIGPAGLALDAAGRPLVAYALWRPSRKTFLRLVRFDARGRPHARLGDAKGVSAEPDARRGRAGRAPVGRGARRGDLCAGGDRVEPDPGRLAGPVRPFERARHSDRSRRHGRLGLDGLCGVDGGVSHAWAAGGRSGRITGRRAGSAVAIENAVLAGLALTPDGPELAANRCFDGVCLGLVGSSGLDGVVAGFAASRDGSRSVLLAGDARARLLPLTHRPPRTHCAEPRPVRPRRRRHRRPRHPLPRARRRPARRRRNVPRRGRRLLRRRRSDSRPDRGRPTAPSTSIPRPRCPTRRSCRR